MIHHPSTLTICRKKRPQEFFVHNQQQQIQTAADMIQGCHGAPQVDSQTWHCLSMGLHS